MVTSQRMHKGNVVGHACIEVLIISLPSVLIGVVVQIAKAMDICHSNIYEIFNIQERIRVSKATLKNK